MKECELCGGRARMYCEADRASLCWDCDEKVHGANFLVAKHPRVLLCHVCQSRTPWTSCGAKLTPTVSVCQSCVGRCSKIDLNEDQESESANNEEEEGYYDDEEDEEEEDDEEEIEDDDEDENQVVPWSCCSYQPEQLPPAVSGSDSEAEISVSKRLRENVDVDCSDNEVGFDGTSSFGGSLRPLKRPKVGEEKNGDTESEWRVTAIMSSIQRLEKEAIDGGGNASSTVLRICKLSRNESH